MKNLKIIFTTCYLFLIITVIHAQNLSDIATVNISKGWVYFKYNSNINPLKVFDSYKASFNLSADHQMKLAGTFDDKLGYTHYRFQEYFKGVQVEGCQYLIHAKNNIAKTGNGKIVSTINLNTIPQVSSDMAVIYAIKSVPAIKYMWQDVQEEQLLKQLTNNKNASYIPKPQLIIFDKNFSSENTDFRLAFKVEIYAKIPLKREFVYIDANTGEFLISVNMLVTTDVPGVAVTQYSGINTIMTDSVSPNNYVLSESHRGAGNGIKTFNMLQGTDYTAAVNFKDSDNYWNNINSLKDEYATDAHWGAEKTYDYYYQTFGRNSFDDLGATINSFVHYDVGYDNAFWDGTRMTYGDGGTYKPFVALDVCGHEITHAVTEHTCNLNYQNESGALNEAFSDIFGTAIEHYARPLNWDWLIGKDISNNGTPLRSMADPKLYQNPDTYNGLYWATGTADNGGVHTNSGVANHWFYLLAAGDTGTNDNNVFYNVSGIGIDKAAAIAYRTLSVYLTGSSDYLATRDASIQAAEDLFGACSNELKQTANAWYAVGVGQPIADNDISLLNIISPVSSCGLTNEFIAVQVKYNGCNIPIPVGDTIFFGYKFDNNANVFDTLILTSQVNGGDTLNFTFSQTCNASGVGIHTVKSWAKLQGDTINSNDTLKNYQFTNKLKQNVDFGVVSINSPVSACRLTNAETIGITVGFFGCDSIIAGDSIPVAYRIGVGNTFWDTIIIEHTIYPNQTISHVFSTPVDMSNPATYNVSAWTKYRMDSLITNDKISGYAVKNPFPIDMNKITFENANHSLDSALITVHACSGVLLSTVSHSTGIRGLQMTGGDVLSYMDQIVMPDSTNAWTVDSILQAKVKFCVDARTWNTAYISFDLKQTFSMATKLFLGSDFPAESSLRLLVNDNWIGSTYNPSTYNSDPFINHLLNISTYAGQYLNICFNSLCAFSQAKEPPQATALGSKGDNAYIDNVRVFRAPNAVDDTISTPYNTPVTLNILSNDSNYNVSSLQFSILSQPLNGAAIIVNDSVKYTPNTGYSGKDTIKCMINYSDFPTIYDTSLYIVNVAHNQGIENISVYSSANIYPNPAKGLINIDYTSSKPGKISVEIDDIIGQTVFLNSLDVIDGVNRIKLNLNSLQEGVYIIKIHNKTGVITNKIIKN